MGLFSRATKGQQPRIISPPRKRIVGDPAAHPSRVDKHEANAEAKAAEVFNIVPKNVGRIKSASEIYQAKRVAAIKRRADKEYAAYAKISDLAADPEHPVDFYSGPATGFAEWQRAKSAGIRNLPTTKAEGKLPESVKTLVKAMKANGLADCYFFRMMDKDATGLVTKREFETGLSLLKIDTTKVEILNLES